MEFIYMARSKRIFNEKECYNHLCKSALNCRYFKGKAPENLRVMGIIKRDSCASYERKGSDYVRTKKFKGF